MMDMFVSVFMEAAADWASESSIEGEDGGCCDIIMIEELET